MDYVQLTDKDFAGLRAERITVLEGEHFRLALRREEAMEVAEFEAISAQMAELHRRIALHRQALAPTDTTVEQRADADA